MPDVFTGKAIDIVTYLMDADKDALWDLLLHKSKRKRTLSANKYYWNLVDELVLKTKVPKAKIHNLYLRQVGAVEKIGDRPVYILLPDNDETEEQVLLASTYHLAPRRETKVGTDGKTYRWYVLLKGSSDYSVEQMNVLINLAVQDAVAQGIEVMSPEELAHLIELEKNNKDKR